MANRYVRKSGSDSNGGTSPTDAWLTWGHALGASGIASGGVLYVGAGTYRETITLANPIPTAETKVVGDVDGSHTRDAGEVVLSAFVTNDTTAPVSNVPLVQMGGRNFMTLENITFMGGSNNGCCISASVANAAANITLRRCVFIPGTVLGDLISLTVLVDTNMGWLIERCVFMTTMNRAIITVSAPTSSVADYDVGVSLVNCLAIQGGGSQGVSVTGTGANAFKGGGVKLANCTIFGGSNAMLCTGAGLLSTSIPCTVYNSLCLHQGGTGAVQAATSGQLVEDYNYIVSNNPRSNVAVGTHSLSTVSRALLLNMGHALLHGFGPPRPWALPNAGSPLLGMGNKAGSTGVDLFNNPRPGDATNAVGAMEYFVPAAGIPKGRVI